MRVVFFDLARLALNISYVILGKRKVVLRDRGAVQWTGAKEKSARPRQCVEGPLKSILGKFIDGSIGVNGYSFDICRGGSTAGLTTAIQRAGSLHCLTGQEKTPSH